MEEKPIIECDISKCVECHACEAACKAYNHVETGVKLRRVESFWEGNFPDVKNHSQSIGCHHCRDAPCVEVCLAVAIVQNQNTQVVTVDSSRCQGSQACADACPYDVPQFGQDGKMQKCDLCFDILDPTDIPVCVRTCPSGALILNR